MVCFQAANRDGRYRKLLADGDRFLKGLQFSEADGRNPSDVTYGGVGYSGAERPDLSNTHFLMEALQAAGDGPQDDAVKRGSSSCRAARISKPSSTRRRSLRRIPTAVSITRQPEMATAPPEKLPKAGCAATAR